MPYHLLSSPAVPFAAMLVAAATAIIYRRRRRSRAAKPARPAVNADGYPVPGTRRWAAALFYNGVIDLDELCRFYAAHPEDEPKKEEGTK